MFTQVSPSLRAFGKQSVDVGCIAVAAEQVCGVGFVARPCGIARIANGNLRRIPIERDANIVSDEGNCVAGERAASTDGSRCVVA